MLGRSAWDAMEVGAERNCILPTGLLPGRETCVGKVHDVERWSEAEDSVAELITGIQPNEESWNSRKAIADYVQSLIGKCFPCQVFTFGSLPLKTSLLDGDIDLTVFSNNDSLKDSWTDKVFRVLKEEEKNENAEFHLTDVHRIDAGVKVIKCLVESIVVDISFNQIGGLGTLCFLEEMDHLINQNHLFKRSVILIKAWCYYESRILGAHHGLISTYALETLILYIFHVFDITFIGPLEVLYRFLELFSNFDWDNFCVSIWGPVPIHLLPEMAVIPPRKDSGELFHKKFFLKSCSMFYDILADGRHRESRSFVSKYFNIIDPLCMHNNLGRSVCKGNFFRIRSAFSFGSKKLAELLALPKEEMISELTKFFTNTWERQRGGPQNNFTIQIGASYIFGDISNSKERNDDNLEYLGGKHLIDFGMSFYGASSQILRIINQRSKDICSHNCSPMVDCHSKNQEDFNNKIINKNQDHAERALESSEPVSADKNHENLSSNCSNSIKKGDHRLMKHEVCRFCSANNFFLSGIIFQKSDKDDALASRSEHDCRSESLSFRVMSGETVKSIDDSSCSGKNSSLQAVVSNVGTRSYHASLSMIAVSRQGEPENCKTPQGTGNSEISINRTSQKRDSGYTIGTELVLSSNSEQRAIVNSGVVSSALYATGPPVPFLEMLQSYSIPSQGSFYGGSNGEFYGESLNDTTAFNGNANLDGLFDQHEWLSHNIPFLGPSAYPYPIGVPVVVNNFQGIFPPVGQPRSILFQGSKSFSALNILPETQIRTSDILTFGDGAGAGYYHGGIRAYPSNPVLPRGPDQPT